MPIEYSISLDLDIQVARWWGKVDISEYRTMFAAYLQDRNYRLGRPELCDLSGVTELDADFARIWSVLTMVNEQANGAPVSTHCVIFAPHDTIFGLGRMYQSLAENAGGVQVQVVRTEAEALAAMGLPGESIADLAAHGTFISPQPAIG